MRLRLLSLTLLLPLTSCAAMSLMPAQDTVSRDLDPDRPPGAFGDGPGAVRPVRVAVVGSVGASCSDTSTDESPVFDGTVDEDDVAIRLGFEAEVGEHFGFGISYIDLGETEFDGLYMGTSSVGTVETSGVEVTATGKYELGNKVFATATVGGLFWTQDERETFGGAPDDESDSGFDPLLGVGLERSLGGAARARVAYSRYFGVNGDDIDTILFSLLWTL